MPLCFIKDKAMSVGSCCSFLNVYISLQIHVFCRQVVPMGTPTVMATVNLIKVTIEAATEATVHPMTPVWKISSERFELPWTTLVNSGLSCLMICAKTVKTTIQGKVNRQGQDMDGNKVTQNHIVGTAMIQAAIQMQLSMMDLHIKTGTLKYVSMSTDLTWISMSKSWLSNSSLKSWRVHIKDKMSIGHRPQAVSCYFYLGISEPWFWLILTFSIWTCSSRASWRLWVPWRLFLQWRWRLLWRRRQLLLQLLRRLRLWWWRRSRDQKVQQEQERKEERTGARRRRKLATLGHSKTWQRWNRSGRHCCWTHSWDHQAHIQTAKFQGIKSKDTRLTSLAFNLCYFLLSCDAVKINSRVNLSSLFCSLMMDRRKKILSKMCCDVF